MINYFYTGGYSVNLTELGQGLEWQEFVGDAHGFVYVVDSLAGESDYSDARRDLLSLATCTPVFLKHKPLLMYVSFVISCY